MAENTIERVRQAEVDAEAKTRDAAQEAGRILDEARTEAKAMLNRAEDSAADKAAAEVAAAHESSKGMLEAYMEALSGDMEGLVASAREKQPEAIKKLLGMLA